MNKTKKAAGAILGAMDPIFRRWMQALAARIPADSPIRSDFLESGVGIIKSLVESFSDTLPPVAGALLEKVTDLSDFFSGALGGVSAEKVGETLDGWLSAFTRSAEKRLTGAKTLEEINSCREVLRQELIIRQELAEMIRAAKPAAPVFTADREAEWKRIKEFSDRQAKRLAKPVGQLADWLENLPGGKRREKFKPRWTTLGTLAKGGRDE